MSKKPSDNPSDWIVKHSRSKNGRPYYVNIKTKTSSWEKPSCLCSSPERLRQPKETTKKGIFKAIGDEEPKETSPRKQFDDDKNKTRTFQEMKILAKPQIDQDSKPSLFSGLPKPVSKPLNFGNSKVDEKLAIILKRLKKKKESEVSKQTLTDKVKSPTDTLGGKSARRFVPRVLLAGKVETKTGKSSDGIIGKTAESKQIGKSYISQNEKPLRRTRSSTACEDKVLEKNVRILKRTTSKTEETSDAESKGENMFFESITKRFKGNRGTIVKEQKQFKNSKDGLRSSNIGTLKGGQNKETQKGLLKTLYSPPLEKTELEISAQEKLLNAIHFQPSPRKYKVATRRQKLMNAKLSEPSSENKNNDAKTNTNSGLTQPQRDKNNNTVDRKTKEKFTQNRNLPKLLTSVISGETSVAECGQQCSSNSRNQQIQNVPTSAVSDGVGGQQCSSNSRNQHVPNMLTSAVSDGDDDVDMLDLTGDPEDECEMDYETYSLTENCVIEESKGCGVESKLYIIVDTNVLISNLDVIKRLVTSSRNDYESVQLDLPNLKHKLRGTHLASSSDVITKVGGHHSVVVIPWIVLQELDSLKDSYKSLSHDEEISKRQKVMAPIRFLFRCFKDRSSQVKGQTAAEARISNTELQSKENDDKILGCSLLWRKKYPQGQVILLTNDINLCNKAMVNGLTTYTAENIESELKLLRTNQNRDDPQPSSDRSPNNRLTPSPTTPSTSKTPYTSGRKSSHKVNSNELVQNVFQNVWSTLNDCCNQMSSVIDNPNVNRTEVLTCLSKLHKTTRQLKIDFDSILQIGAHEDLEENTARFFTMSQTLNRFFQELDIPATVKPISASFLKHYFQGHREILENGFDQLRAMSETVDAFVDRVSEEERTAFKISH